MPVLLFYLPVLNNQFVNWDDRDNIYENPFIRHLDLSSLRWMLTNFHAGYWMPLTWFSFALNYQAGGLNPIGFHLTNVLLHALNTALVFFAGFRILEEWQKTRGGPDGAEKEKTLKAAAFLTALLFGLHPIHVESVAWATERKDLLCSLFYLYSLLAYLDFAGSGSRDKAKWLACFTAFLLALMSKPMALTLPIVLFIFDYWPLKRFPQLGMRTVMEKSPFFFAALVAALETKQGALTSTANGDEWFWILNGFRSVLFYLYQLLVPASFCPFYPFPHHVTDAYFSINILLALGVLGISSSLYVLRNQRPSIWAAWLFYLVTLLPVLGFIQIGAQAAADRYTYLPSLALFLPLSYWVSQKLAPQKFLFWFLLCLILGGLGFKTVQQIGVWRNSQTFWETVVDDYPDDNPNALTNLGLVYLNGGRVDDAITMFDRAILIPPPMAFTHDGMGKALAQKGRLEEAVEQYKVAIQMDPRYSSWYRDLAEAYQRLGMEDAAAVQLRMADQIERQYGGNS